MRASRNLNRLSPIQGTKQGLNGVTLVSSGVQQLDSILGGGISVGSIVLVMEDSFSPHHLILLRYFLAQGVVHQHSTCYCSPLPEPGKFLGTLPSYNEKDNEKDRENAQGASGQGDDHGLRIAFQYQRFISEQDALQTRRRERQLATGSFHRSERSAPPSSSEKQFCSNFDLRKPLDRAMIASTFVECCQIGPSTNGLVGLHQKISSFLQNPRRGSEGPPPGIPRIAVQSLGAPQSHVTAGDAKKLVRWLFLLKEMVQSSGSVALVTIPGALFPPPLLATLQHLADTVLSLHHLREEDRAMSDVVSDYADAVGLLRVVKRRALNSMVPTVLSSNTFVMKVERRRKVTLETLQQLPVDVGPQSSASSVACSGPSEGSKTLDF